MNILYDLDGTISDPIEGITKSLNYALSKLGRKEHESENLSKYIGPSLKVALGELLGTDNEGELARAVELYRERYIPTGFKENTLYPDIEAHLSQSKAAGHRQYIATSKRDDIAKSVIRNFRLTRYFERVFGCGDGKSKIELVEGILSTEQLDRSETVMIGDRSFDIEAGKTNGIRTIGVTWGYGTREELQNAGATSIASTIEELREQIMPDKPRK